MRAEAPATKIVYMSGYASDDVLSTVSPDDVLLQKPFDASVLLRVVREALDAVPLRA
jgi:hypothetical protein